ncbi:thioredoxin [Gilvimarinus sp. F26214L]|uniref:thioredoxin n=1 Tax=Gilvimarinus sp. DZF01 TaxID=3461371 RepID=UPI004045ED4F
MQEGSSRMSDSIVDIDQSNAQQMLIEESQQRPVLVDFWADWCGPCKSLMPVLEKLAQEYAGQFLLARVNADEQQMIASQFGVRSLPTVVLMKDGQPVDGFMGAQPETAVREFLEKHLPKPWDSMLEQGRALLAEGNHTEALGVLRQAHQQSGERSDIGILLAQVYLELNRTNEAEAIIGKIPMVDQDAAYEQVKAQLELKRQAAKSPELEALEKKLQAEPENLDAAYQLAVLYNQDGHHREALELLYAILQKNLNFQDGAAKKSMMDMIASLGKGDPLAVEYQRKVYTLLY